MQKQTYFARSFFFASAALMLTLALAPSGFANAAPIADDAVDVKRPPAPEGCEGITTPVCAEADIGGFIYKYYFKP